LTLPDRCVIVVAVERGRSRVLLVEDDAAVRTVVDRQLRSLGWEVVALATGRDAIRLVERGTRVEVLLTDLDLPDVGGVMVARAITAAAPGTRVVFMSGSVPAVPLEPSVAPFLLKPFSRIALADALAG
jgi:CheY-like chemotaxis protein